MGQWIPVVAGMTNSFVVQQNFYLSLYLHFGVAGVIIFGESTGMWVRGLRKAYTQTAQYFVALVSA